MNENANFWDIWENPTNHALCGLCGEWVHLDECCSLLDHDEVYHDECLTKLRKGQYDPYVCFDKESADAVVEWIKNW